MMAWAAFWGFCAIAVICSCIYKIVYVRTTHEAPPDLDLQIPQPTGEVRR